MTNLTDLTLNTRVKVKTYDQTASGPYSGMVVGVVTYDIALSVGEQIASRHEEIRALRLAATGTTLPDLSTEKFLVLNIGEPRPVVIAASWIDGSIEIVQQAEIVTIELIDATPSDINLALNLLKSNGIVCRIRK